jgi:hypothetical protein
VCSVEAWLMDAAARDTVVAALGLPPGLGPRVLQYVALFRPQKRALSWDRAAKIWRELSGAINAAQVRRHGRLWPAPLATWEQALDTVLEARDTGKLLLPLCSHGYLWEVVAGIAAKAEARGEAASMSAARGATPIGAHPSHRTYTEPADYAVEKRPMPQDVREKLRGFGSAGASPAGSPDAARTAHPTEDDA